MFTACPCVPGEEAGDGGNTCPDQVTQQNPSVSSRLAAQLLLNTTSLLHTLKAKFWAELCIHQLHGFVITRSCNLVCFRTASNLYLNHLLPRAVRFLIELIFMSSLCRPLIVKHPPAFFYLYHAVFLGLKRS